MTSTTTSQENSHLHSLPTTEGQQSGSGLGTVHGSNPGDKAPPVSAKLEEFGKGIKGAAAGIHGAGETLRGGLNAAVDQTFGDQSGAAKNEAIAREGEQEMISGKFH